VNRYFECTRGIVSCVQCKEHLTVINFKHHSYYRYSTKHCDISITIQEL